ncbi:MAG: ABC transporter permease, partial [bacterium]
VMPLKNAQELFSIPDGITDVVFTTTNFREADKAAKSFAKRIDESNLEVLSWEETMPELKQLILLDNISGVFYLVFILIIVGIEIFNTTMMSVVERTREFGILQSIGMRPNQIGGLIFMESLIKMAISLGIGFMLSAAVVFTLEQHPIPLPERLAEAYADYGFVIDALKFSNSPKVFYEPILTIAIFAIIAFLLPMYKTTRLTPMEAFRKT